MSRHSSMGSVKNRPTALSSKSFARYEPATPPSPSRHRASTIQTTSSLKKPVLPEQVRDDIFEKTNGEDEETPTTPTVLMRTHSLPDKFDELPIELASLTDRFVDSLSAKTYAEPPSVDQLSGLFQDFYIRAASSISIHISALMSRINRETSPAPSVSSKRSKNLSRQGSSDSLRPASLSGAAQQMLTASEVTEKRRARRLLEYKRILLEEAVEKRACEKVYDKIWRHKSTLDEMKDEKLRSKTAALSLVGIGLKDLGIDLGSDKTVGDVDEALKPARDHLAQMNDEKYPLGKLQHLTEAHKAIVDTLSSIHPSSSSADEILPTLIYTLIISPLEGINIISNLHFIQRFRAASKVDGEAAYCLTNLEAAISFLENVDLASLREDEHPEGPKKSSAFASTPTTEKADPFPKMATSTTAPSSLSVDVTTTQSGSGKTAVSSLKTQIDKAPPLVSPRHNRTLSDLLVPPKNVISSANEAVRYTAEEGFKNISTTLDNSFKMLLGKLKERGQGDSQAEVIVPKTLDEARQLVSKPAGMDADDSAMSESSSLADKDPDSGIPGNLTKTEERILNLLGGRKAGPTRERSVDSLRSNSSINNSNKRVAFAANGSTPTESTTGDKTSTITLTASDSSTPTPTPIQTTATPAPAAAAAPSAFDSVKNLGSSLNPISHIGSAFGGAFRGFGSRTTSTGPSPSPSPTPQVVSPAEKEKDNKPTKPTPSTSSSNPAPTTAGTSSTTSTQTSGTSSTAGLARDSEVTTPTITLKNLDELETSQIRLAPPIQKFMDLHDEMDLRVGEVGELLRDYQRLGRVLDMLRERGDD